MKPYSNLTVIEDQNQIGKTSKRSFHSTALKIKLSFANEEATVQVYTNTHYLSLVICTTFLSFYHSSFLITTKRNLYQESRFYYKKLSGFCYCTSNSKNNI